MLRATPAELGRELGFPDAIVDRPGRAALVARRRLEPAGGSYRLLDARPVDEGEREAGRRPRKPRPTATPPEGRAAALRRGRPRVLRPGRATVDRLVELGREVAELRASLKTSREEARASREARVEPSGARETLSAKVRELEPRAEMAESNLRTLLASVAGRGRNRTTGLGFRDGGDPRCPEGRGRRRRGAATSARSELDLAGEPGSAEAGSDVAETEPARRSSPIRKPRSTRRGGPGRAPRSRSSPVTSPDAEFAAPPDATTGHRGWNRHPVGIASGPAARPAGSAGRSRRPPAPRRARPSCTGVAAAAARPRPGRSPRSGRGTSPRRDPPRSTPAPGRGSRS